MDILIGRKARLMTRYSPRWAVNITFLRLVTKLATFAMIASKHGGQLLNEFFIYSKVITPSLGWRIFRMTAVALGPKIFCKFLLIPIYSRVKLTVASLE